MHAFLIVITIHFQARWYWKDLFRCAIDYNVLGDVKYDTSGQSAYVESHAFKFADTTSIAFACTIKVCSPSKENCADTTVTQTSLFVIVAHFVLNIFTFSRLNAHLWR